jgi:hypothetical protein
MSAASNHIKLYKPTDVLDFGEHEGKVIESVARDHTDYFIWLVAFANSFFISKEDLDALRQKYPQLDSGFKSEYAYNRKLSLFEDQEFRAIFNADMSKWTHIRETSRSKLQRERYPSDEALYVDLDYNDESLITKDIHTWKFVQFCVDQDATPMIKVFCYSVRDLNTRTRNYTESWGYKKQANPIHYFMFSLTMNDFDFGYLARTLIHMGLATTTE